MTKEVFLCIFTVLSPLNHFS